MSVSRAVVSFIIAVLVTASLQARQAAPRVIPIEVADHMKFGVASITAKPGERLKVVLKHVGQMPKAAMGHNFVLLQKGTDPKAFVDASAAARDTEYIAPAAKAQVLAATSLIGGGETTEVVFAAPRQAGRYTYLCSFPGHYAMGMKGILTVK